MLSTSMLTCSRVNVMISNFGKTMGPEGSGRKTFRIETQSTRSERRNIGYNELDSIKKDDAGSNSSDPPGENET